MSRCELDALVDNKSPGDAPDAVGATPPSRRVLRFEVTADIFATGYSAPARGRQKHGARRSPARDGVTCSVAPPTAAAAVPGFTSCVAHAATLNPKADQPRKQLSQRELPPRMQQTSGRRPAPLDPILLGQARRVSGRRAPRGVRSTSTPRRYSACRYCSGCSTRSFAVRR